MLGVCVVSVFLGLVFVLGVSADPPSYRAVKETTLHETESTERRIALGRIEPQPGETFRDCPTCPELVVVPAGSFPMGSPASEEGRFSCPNEGPVHRVTIGQAFAVGMYEVTFAEWDACVNGGGCNGYRPDDEGWGREQRPVISVSWEDARAYVQWVSEKTGKTYRLLSEAEWEYMARAGTTTARYWGEGEVEQCRYANGADQTAKQYNRGWTVVACDDGHYRTAPVGSYAANGFGLYDVLGNVWEWVQDCWQGSYAGAPSDGPRCAQRWEWESEDDCSARVLRGGAWSSESRYLRSAYRDRIDPDLRNVFIGFRIARSLP